MVRAQENRGQKTWRKNYPSGSGFGGGNGKGLVMKVWWCVSELAEDLLALAVGW